MRKTNTLRLFCAIQMPSEVRHPLSAHAKRLRDLFPNASASWTRDDNHHLTLKFIGEVEEARATRLSAATERAASSVEPFTVIVDGPGVFPKRVLWIGIDDPSGRLGKLQQRLEEECAHEGFPKEERAFHPHLTLARLRKPQNSRELEEQHKQARFVPVEVKVDELVVIKSELSSSGSKYTVLSRHKLAESIREDRPEEPQG